MNFTLEQVKKRAIAVRNAETQAHGRGLSWDKVLIIGEEAAAKWDAEQAPKPEPARTPQVGDWVRNPEYPQSDILQVSFVQDGMAMVRGRDFVFDLTDVELVGPPIEVRPGDYVRARVGMRFEHARVEALEATGMYRISCPQAFWCMRDGLSLLALPEPPDDRLIFKPKEQQ